MLQTHTPSSGSPEAPDRRQRLEWTAAPGPTGVVLEEVGGR